MHEGYAGHTKRGCAVDHVQLAYLGRPLAHVRHFCAHLAGLKGREAGHLQPGAARVRGRMQGIQHITRILNGRYFSHRWQRQLLRDIRVDLRKQLTRGKMGDEVGAVWVEGGGCDGVASTKWHTRHTQTFGKWATFLSNTIKKLVMYTWPAVSRHAPNQLMTLAGTGPG